MRHYKAPTIKTPKSRAIINNQSEERTEGLIKEPRIFGNIDYDIYPRELKTYGHKKNCTQVFTATLFIIAKK